MNTILSKNLQPSKWSGGTTTQLFIFPVSSKYKEMNFDFRLSTATVEVETSIFTRLPGVQRTLMVLQGGLKLSHKLHHSSSLKQFESDNFLGDWDTSSVGIVSDFNLMVRNPDLKGFVEHVYLEKSDEKVFETKKHGFLYIYQGAVELNDQIQLSSGDSFYFDETDKVELKGTSQADLIFAKIE